MSLISAADLKQSIHSVLENHRRTIAITCGLFVLRKIVRWYKTVTPKHCVLELHLPSDLLLVDDVQPELAFLSEAIPLRALTHTLEIASRDPRVKGLMLRLSMPRFSSLALLMEFRDALADFKAKGKPIVVYADTLSYFQPAPALFYLASVATTVVMSPLGSVAAIDPFLAIPFIKTMLAKLGIVGDIDSRSEFKNFKDFFTQTKMTEAHQKSVESLFQDLMQTLINGIAEARGMTPAAVRAIFDSGPHTADAAKAAGLIDVVAYRDQAYDDILPATCGLKSKDDMNLRYFKKYTEQKSHLSPWKPTGLAALVRSPTQVAIIYLRGNIHLGRSHPNLDGKSPSIGSDTACMLIRSAANDKSIKGLIIRIDSGGGDAIASDLILRELLQARARGKKVVVTMGGLAASGGYFIACGADKIVAMPSTITGSIGVVFGKFVMKELLTDKIGIDYDTSVQTGERGRLSSQLEPYSAEEGVKYRDQVLDDFYLGFKQRVASGRGLTMEAVEEIARGRVWTGSQALERKLVDRLGSTRTAVDEMRALLNLAPGAPLRIRRFPELSLTTLLNPPRNSNEEKHHLVSVGSSVTGVFGMLSQLATSIRLVAALVFAPSGSGASVLQELLAQQNAASNPMSSAMSTPSSVSAAAAAFNN